jgi:tetratricopeptide (TPR) repeat protein
MKKKNIISSFIIALLMTTLWFYIYRDLPSEQDNIDNMTNNIATTTSLVENVSINQGENSKEIKVVTVDLEDDKEDQQNKQIIRPIPDLDRVLVYPEGFSKEAQDIIAEKISKTSQELKNDPNSISNWIELGLNRKMLDDYEGSRQAWEYAKLVSPKNFVVRGNLGDLYAYYLRDNQKAEENYLKALELGPSQIYLYFKTAEFYRDFLLDNQKAKETVQMGLINNPTSQELKDLLNSF